MSQDNTIKNFLKDSLKSTKTFEFIDQNKAEDVRKLALKHAKNEEIDLTFALKQISGWQAARKKIPSWAALKGIIYPQHISLEQCSSEGTAQYKANIIDRLIKSNQCLNNAKQPLSLVDLTAGLGVDCAFMGKELQTTYVEMSEELCAIAQNNFPIIGLKTAKIVNGDGIAYLSRLEHATFIYIDPARRNAHGTKTVAIEDCTPNIIEHKATLTQKSCYTIVKLSPMLDYHKALQELNKDEDIVREIHIISVKNECKELLFVLSKEPIPLTLYCTNDNQTLKINYPFNNYQQIATDYAAAKYLYEPNASMMKAGCFGYLCETFNIKSLAPNTHLFVAEKYIKNFPGRIFCIENITTFNKKELKQTIKDLKAANITTRNFPLSVEQLRKKLKLKEGGNTYLFATTDSKNTHILLICSKV